jgi:hypothetical protein
MLYLLTFLGIFVLSSEDLLTCDEDRVNNKVTDLSDKPVDVVDALEDASKDSIQLKLVQVGSNGLNNILHDAHARLE